LTSGTSAARSERPADQAAVGSAVSLDGNARTEPFGAAILGSVVTATRLRPYTDADLPLTVALETDPVVKRELGGVLDAQEAARVHRERLERMSRGELFYTVYVDDDPEPAGIGAVFATPWDGEVIYEAGIMLLPDKARRGVGQATLAQLAERARTELRLARVHGFTAVGNDGGNTICRRLGWTLLGECDLDYEGRPLRCNHWVKDLTP
jgi:RimJ/RimL family protein N-acetyltransferase